jgi:acetamidase/formamidase
MCASPRSATGKYPVPRLISTFREVGGMTTERPADATVPASDDNVHYEWNNDIDPIATVESGDVVEFECRDAREDQFDLETTIADVKAMDHGEGIPLTGPVAVEGADPGDVLQIEVLDVDHGDVGWTLFYPGEREAGLLPEEFPDWGLHVWDLSDGVGAFVDDIELPLAPFPGTVGLAPGEDGAHSTTPPRTVGGNMDVKYLTSGAILYLPVEVAGALFSLGDGHAAQGDGEVCGGAIETALDVTCRFEVRSDLSVEAPQFRPGDRPDLPEAPVPTYATSGVSDDLMDAAKRAVSAMVDHLHAHRDLSREYAYILCSVAADLKINEVVDAPNWVVSAHLREDIFPE